MSFLNRLTPIRTSYSSPPSSQPSPNTIGEGAYWRVHEDPTDPAYVYRVSLLPLTKNKNVRSKAKQRSNQFLNLTKNRRTRNKVVPANQLPPSIRSNNGYAIRMPHLGINLIDYMESRYKPHKQDMSIAPHLLKEISTLIHQLAILSEKGLCHGDIHMSNIMIQPDTLDLHLIDFDLLDTKEETINRLFHGEQKDLISAWIPPEWLIWRSQESRIAQYARNFVNSFSEYVACRQMKLDSFRELLLTVRAPTTPSVDTFDSFALAMPLLSLLTVLYPECNPPVTMYHPIPDTLIMINKKITELKKRIKILTDYGEHEPNDRSNEGKELVRIRRQLKEAEAERAEELKREEVVTPEIVPWIPNLFRPIKNTVEGAIQQTKQLLLEMADININERLSISKADQRMRAIISSGGRHTRRRRR